MNRLTAKVAEMGIYARFASSDEFDIIQKLGEYEDLEEAGRLVKLPCKAGDTVYTVDGDEIVNHTVNYLTIYPDCIALNIEIPDEQFDYVAIDIDVSAIGKTVFLTREAAEAGRQGEQAAKPPTSPALEGAEQ